MSLSVDSSQHNQGDTLRDTRWNDYYFRSLATEHWKRDGHTVYARANFEHQLERGQRLSGYYRYSKSDVDLTNAATVSDSSSYASMYTYTDRGLPTTRWYRSRSATHDVRHGTGQSEERRHQTMINLKWAVSERSKVHAGAYYSRTTSDLFTDEPVTADRWSSWWRTRRDTASHFDSTYYGRYEAKSLRWEYRSRYWTIQVPVILEFQINEHVGLMLGINRILESWKITDETLATFTRRRVTENGQVEQETNFAERYVEPEESITEDYTALLASVDYILSPQVKIRLMMEPQTEGKFEIAQWWLSFTAQL
jgi:hypothetical protein